MERPYQLYYSHLAAHACEHALRCLPKACALAWPTRTASGPGRQHEHNRCDSPFALRPIDPPCRLAAAQVWWCVGTGLEALLATWLLNTHGWRPLLAVSAVPLGGCPLAPVLPDCAPWGCTPAVRLLSSRAADNYRTLHRSPQPHLPSVVAPRWACRGQGAPVKTTATYTAFCPLHQSDA